MKNKIKILTALVLIIAAFALISNSSYIHSDNKEFSDCLDSIDGTDAECDSCWVTVYSK